MTDKPQPDSGADVLRQTLVDELIAHGTITTPGVEAAMRTVPRHAFTPGASIEAGYRDAAVPYEHSDHGACFGPVPAPSLVAALLEAAEVDAGMRVLEVGSGGYAVALLSHLTTARGHVASVAAERQGNGAQTTHAMRGTADSRVRRLAPYDRIIVTVGVSDAPRTWAEALTAGGRLVMPVDVRARAQRIIAFDRDGDLLHSASVSCAQPIEPIVDSARSPHRITAHDAGIILEFDDGKPADAEQLAAASASTYVEMSTGVTVRESDDDLQLYLAVRLPAAAHLALEQTNRLEAGLAEPRSGFPALAAGAGSIAYLAARTIRRGAKQQVEYVACGIGPGAAAAASQLAHYVEYWQAHLRGHGDPEITVSPIGVKPDGFDGETTIVKQHSAIHLAFPGTFSTSVSAL